VHCGQLDGALIGGIYAAGKLDVYADWVSKLTRRDVLRLLDWSFRRGSVFKGERVIDEMRRLVGEVDIEDLAVQVTAVATDLHSEREVWFVRGPLWAAIRASVSVPLVFAPVVSDGRLLVDGGVINPVPIAPTMSSRGRMFAVDLNGPPLERGHREAGDVERASATRVTRARSPRAMELALRSVDLVQTTIGRMKLAAYRPQVLIAIPSGAHAPLVGGSSSSYGRA
jgi:NTE family protein